MSSRKFAPPAPACRVCHSSHVPCLALCLLSVLHFHWLISSVSIAISGIYTSALSPFLCLFFSLVLLPLCLPTSKFFRIGIYLYALFTV